MGSNPIGDASTYADSTGTLSPISPQKPKRRRYDYRVERHALGGAIQRCHNTNNTAYRYYGARGISVCDKWRRPGGAEKFIAHIGRRPSERHSLDRIDNDGNYEPGNVRWATSSQQNNNRRPRGPREEHLDAARQFLIDQKHDREERRKRREAVLAELDKYEHLSGSELQALVRKLECSYPSWVDKA